jgi:hypothetical protein
MLAVNTRFFIFMLLVGCQSINKNDVVPEGIAISEIRKNGKLEIAFVYDSKQQVIEIQKYFDDGKSLWESHRYSWKNNRVAEYQVWSSHPLYLSSLPKPGKPLLLQNKQTFEYDVQGRVSRTNMFIDTDELRTYSTHKYNNAGRKTETKVFGPNGQETYRYAYNYDRDNNLIQFESSFWEYDNKPNPFQKLNVPYWEESWKSPNNVTSNYGKDNSGRKLNIINYQYTYDSKTELPIKMKSFGEFRDVENYEFVYK